MDLIQIIYVSISCNLNNLPSWEDLCRLTWTLRPILIINTSSPSDDQCIKSLVFTFYNITIKLIDHRSTEVMVKLSSNPELCSCQLTGWIFCMLRIRCSIPSFPSPSCPLNGHQSSDSSPLSSTLSGIRSEACAIKVSEL